MDSATKSELMQEVKELVAEVFGVPVDKVKDDSVFKVDFSNADSLKALELLAAMESKFRIKIPEEKLSSFLTTTDVYGVVNNIING